MKRRVGGLPLVLEVNSFVTQRYKLFGRVEASAMLAADLIVGISPTIAEEIEQSLGRAIADKTEVIPNGVAVERFLLRHGSRFEPRSAIHVGYVGTLKRNYGIETLIDAVRLLHQQGLDVRLHIVGDGPQRYELGKYADGLSAVTFHGAVSFDQVPDVLSRLDVLLYSTTQHHSFQSPIKLYEYMAAAKPIIAMRTPATEALIADGVTGFLVPLNSAAAVAEKVREIAARPDRGLGLGAAARAAVARHTWKARIDQLLNAMQRRGIPI